MEVITDERKAKFLAAAAEEAECESIAAGKSRDRLPMCQNCKHWLRDDDSYADGDCRRYPKYERRTELDTCGEFQPEKEPHE